MRSSVEQVAEVLVDGHVRALLWFGFFVTFKPSEAFLVPYLIERGLSEHEIDREVFPWWTYSFCVWMFIVFAVVEVAGLRAVMYCSAVARVATRLLLIFGRTVAHMQLMQVAFGFASASEIVYYAYVYYLVPRGKFQAVTALSRTAYLLAHVSSALLGQVLGDVEGTSLTSLMYVSLISVLIGCVAVFWFPRVTSSGGGGGSLVVRACELWRECRRSFFIPELRVWAMWWVLGLCTFNLVVNYATDLFYVVDSSLDVDGYVVAAARFVGTVCALSTVHAQPYTVRAWVRAGMVVAGPLVSAVLLVGMAHARALVAVALLYIAFYGVSEFLLAVASARIGTHVKSKRFGSVFTATSAVSVLLQTVFQLVVGHHVLHLSTRNQFNAFATLSALLCVVMVVWLMLESVWRARGGEGVLDDNDEGDPTGTYTQMSDL